MTPSPAHHLARKTVLCVVVAAAIAGGRPRADGRAARDAAAESRVTIIDTRAPGLFDADTPPLRGLQVRYRVDAKILLPLGFTSFEIFHRADVGWVTAGYCDRAVDGDGVIRGYELFSTSRPERAQGLNRLGFFREAVRLSADDAVWTAYFGAMSSSPEKSYSEAKKSIESKQPQVYDVTDGVATPAEARAAVFKVATEAPATSAANLYAAICPLLDQPRRTPISQGSAAHPLPSLAFLGALQASLQAAAQSGGEVDPQHGRVGFVHSGHVKTLEMTSLKRDRDRGRQLAPKGFVRNANDVFCLEYRITSATGTDGAFRMWAELPARREADARGGHPPIVPIAWDFEARSFLRLYCERIQ